MLTKEEFIAENLEHCTAEFPYMLLDRMRSDCTYYLAYETKCNPEYNHLWAHHDPKAQIAYMRYIWEWLPEKPEWLTMEQIDELDKQMNGGD